MAITIKDYNNIDWKSIVYYDITSSTYIRYVNGNRTKNQNKRKAGDEAGYCSYDKYGRDRYAHLKYKNRSYLIHRIIFILQYGDIPDTLVVNHIDFNTHNNSIDNLEVCTFRENLIRTRVTTGVLLHCRNKSGINGVHETTKNNGYKEYKYATATWTSIDGKQHQRLFSYTKYGKEDAWNLAKNFRDSMENQMKDEGRL